MARGASTGRGNYPAANPGVSAKTLREGLKGIAPIRHPNKHMTTTEYKKILKKEPEAGS